MAQNLIYFILFSKDLFRQSYVWCKIIMGGGGGGGRQTCFYITIGVRMHVRAEPQIVFDVSLYIIE
jgi:hypothetical protein